MLDFTLGATRIGPRRESTRTPLRCSTSPGTTPSRPRCVMSTLGRSRSAGRSGGSIRKRTEQSRRSGSELSQEAVEELRERYVAKSAYKNAYTENGESLKL